MTERTHATFLLKLKDANMSPFIPLLQRGFLVKAQVGRSIKHVLCEQCNVKAEYLEERIQTIFLDGKVVDDVNTALLQDGSTVALSAAMPGLVGATFRTGGLLAAFRSGITHREEGVPSETHGVGMVKIKLFNLLIAELGPGFLKEGVWLKKGDAEGLLKGWDDTLGSCRRYVEKDGQDDSPDGLAVFNGSGEPDLVFVKVLVRGDTL